MKHLLAVGRFGKPYGVRGWIKIISYTDPIQNILKYLPWHIIKEQSNMTIQPVNSKLQGGNLIVKFAQCNTPEEAKAYTHIEISVAREQLPKLAVEEYYWVDLIGLTVFNKALENLGIVKNLLATGSNDVLIVIDEAGRERFIPYTQDVILDVNLEQQKIAVDWDAEF